MSELPDVRDGLPIDWIPELIAIDIDDTLTTFMGSLNPIVVDAIERVQDAGVQVALATGRTMSTTFPVARAAGINDLVVCSNGAILASVETQRPIEAVTFDAAPVVEQLMDLVPDAVFAVEDTHGTFRTTHMFDAGALGLSIDVAPLTELIADPVIRLVVRSEHHAEDGFGRVAEQLGFHSVVFGIADVAWMDVGPRGVNKASMLKELCARRDIDPTKTIAIGDSDNDVEMLAWAGLGVAMGHAPERITKHANVLTDGEPGVGVAAVLNALPL